MSALTLLFLRLLSALILYAFWGYAIWLLWQDLRRQSQMMAAMQSPPLALRIGQEVEPGVQSEKLLHFSMPQVLIGRDLACECCLEDLTISTQHARLSYHHSQWWVEDLHSKNGTLLNDVPVTEAVVLASGDRLQCGQVLFSVILGSQAVDNRVKSKL